MQQLLDEGEDKKEPPSYDQGMDDEIPSDFEPKRSFSFSSRHLKRPPDLNIELITHSPLQSQEFIPSHNIPLTALTVSAGNTDGTRPREAHPSPINSQNLSPLALPGHSISLANTPTLLSSFMNVLKKEPEPEHHES